MDPDTTDILRKLAFGQAFILVIITVWIMVRYSRRVSETPREERGKPIHVALIAASYLGFMGYVVLDLYERLGTPATWRIVVALVFFAFGVAAMVYMLTHLSVRRTLLAKISQRMDAEATRELALASERSETRLRRMEEVGQRTADKITDLQACVTVGGQKADAAYGIANELNEKIRDGSSAVKESLDRVHRDAEKAKATAKTVSEQASEIGEVGNDTNQRVRKMEGNGKP